MLISSFQIFAFGLGMAVAGPCLASCLPMIIAYTAGRDGCFRKKLLDILIFLSGRFIAYLLLGALAGISGAALNQAIAPHLAAWRKPVAGSISIGLGITLLAFRRTKEGCCDAVPPLSVAAGGLFLAGFTIGISPCGPLAVLLSEIVLISRSVWQGMWYGAMFGLGTLISSLIIAAGISGILHWLPRRYAAPPRFMRRARLACAMILILLGGLSLFR